VQGELGAEIEAAGPKHCVTMRLILGNDRPNTRLLCELKMRANSFKFEANAYQKRRLEPGNRSLLFPFVTLWINAQNKRNISFILLVLQVTSHDSAHRRVCRRFYSYWNVYRYVNLFTEENCASIL